MNVSQLNIYQSQSGQEKKFLNNKVDHLQMNGPGGTLHLTVITLLSMQRQPSLSGSASSTASGKLEND
jgi:hypothetical protein